MATATHDKATHRLVVLLRPSEKKRLHEIAREEGVSASEIVRRSIASYESSSIEEQEEFKSVLAQMNESLDKAIVAVREARTEVAQTIAQMRERGADAA